MNFIKYMTLVELIVVIVVIGVLTAPAVISMNKAFENYEFQTASKDLWSYLNSMRRKSIYEQEIVKNGVRQQVLYGIEFNDNTYMTYTFIEDSTKEVFIKSDKLLPDEVSLGTYSDLKIGGSYIKYIKQKTINDPTKYTNKILFSNKGRPITGRINADKTLETIPLDQNRIAIFNSGYTIEIELNPITGTIIIDEELE